MALNIGRSVATIREGYLTAVVVGASVEIGGSGTDARDLQLVFTFVPDDGMDPGLFLDGGSAGDDSADNYWIADGSARASGVVVMTRAAGVVSGNTYPLPAISLVSTMAAGTTGTFLLHLVSPGLASQPQPLPNV